jgi:phospholipid/cholesterol/gamma-HCH transport system substrate-binding protein
MVGAGVALLVFGLNYLKGIDLFQRRNIYYAVYNSIDGITQTSPLMYHGLKVGQVLETELLENGSIAVTFQVNEAQLRIPRDSHVKIYSADLFTKAAQIVAGTSTEMASAGDTLIGDKELGITESVSAQIDPLKRKAETMMASVDSVLSSVNVLLGQQNRRELDASFMNMRQTLESLNRSAKRLDDLLASQTGNIGATLGNLRLVSDNFAKHNQALGHIFTNLDSLTSALNDGRLDKALLGMSEASIQLKDVLSKVKNGEGTLGALVHNDSLYRNLNMASHELDLLLEDLRVNPGRYMSIIGRKDRTPKLSDADIQRIKDAYSRSTKP